MHDTYTYYVVNSDFAVEEIISKALKRTNTVICVFHYNKMNDIVVHLASNCLSLDKIKTDQKARGNEYRITFKTDTVNMIYLDVPNNLS